MFRDNALAMICLGTGLCGMLGIVVRGKALLSAAVFCLVVKSGVFAAGTLVQNGVATSSIVIPAGTGTRVQTAAQDLAGYLKQMSGATVPVVSEDNTPSGYKILIGSTTLSPVDPADVTEAKVGYDGFIIKSVAGGLVIAGRNDQGTANGVYHFAEEVLGIHWYSVEDDGPTVPKRDTVKISNLALTVKPSFDWRGQYFSFQQTREAYSKETSPLAKKLAVNRDRWWTFNRLWGTTAETGHVFSAIVPEDLFDTHPEYFPYIDYTFKKDSRTDVIKAAADGSLPKWPWKAGRYKGDASFQRCLSNPAVLKMAVDWAVKQFEKDPSLFGTSLSPNDGPWWCECDVCKVMGDTRSERNLVFDNAVAKANEAKYPDKDYLCYAYWDTLEPPKTVKAHPKVVPVIAALWQCRIHPISSDCPDMVYLRQVVQGWSKASDRIGWRPYISDGPFTFPDVSSLAEEICYVKKHGGIGGYREYQFGPKVNGAMLIWAEIKLLWDATKDPNRLKSEFIKGYYGSAAAQVVEKLYDKIAAGVRTGIKDRKWPEDDGAGLHSLPADEILKPILTGCKIEIDAALKLADSQPEPFRGRIIRDMETLLGKNRAEF